jgi:hypothetical protein
MYLELLRATAHSDRDSTSPRQHCLFATVTLKSKAKLTVTGTKLTCDNTALLALLTLKSNDRQ